MVYTDLEESSVKLILLLTNCGVGIPGLVWVNESGLMRDGLPADHYTRTFLRLIGLEEMDSEETQFILEICSTVNRDVEILINSQPYRTLLKGNEYLHHVIDDVEIIDLLAWFVNTASGVIDKEVGNVFDINYFDDDGTLSLNVYKRVKEGDVMMH